MPAAAPAAAENSAAAATHVDVLIVGAGISGIGAAWHLQHGCPGKSYAIVEMKDTFGGTWETHKYPGVRSDSDLYTFGYSFKPWTGTPIASGQAILDYMGEVIAENGIDRHIRYGRRITHCAFSRASNRWTVRATRRRTVSAGARCAWLAAPWSTHATRTMMRSTCGVTDGVRDTPFERRGASVRAARRARRRR